MEIQQICKLFELAQCGLHRTTGDDSHEFRKIESILSVTPSYLRLPQLEPGWLYSSRLLYQGYESLIWDTDKLLLPPLYVQ